jgi:hypothetical protein
MLKKKKGKKKIGVKFGLQKRGTTLYCFNVSLKFKLQFFPKSKIAKKKKSNT